LNYVDLSFLCVVVQIAENMNSCTFGILSMIRWDVICGKVLGIIQSQVLPSMGCFILRVLVNLD